MANEAATKRFWWDELCGELVEVTDPAQLDGDGWEAVGTAGNATEWRSDRGQSGWLIEALRRSDAESTLDAVEPDWG